MKQVTKSHSFDFDYLQLFGIKIRNAKVELSIAETKGLKASHINKFHRATGLSLDHLAIALNISRKQMDRKMNVGILSPKDADILLNIAKIVYEHFRLYPDIQDFWLFFLAGREEFGGESGLYLSKTEIGRGRVLGQIHKEQNDYLREAQKSERPKNLISSNKSKS